MQKALTAAVERLQQTSLPALEQNVEELRRRAMDPEAPLERLTAVIERDPGLAMRLLRNTNTHKRRHLGTNVATIGHALMLTGLDPLRALPDTVPTIQAVERPDARARLLHQYDRAYHAARQVWEWARLRKDMQADESYLAGLFHNLGEMLLWQHAPGKMAQTEEVVREEGIDPAEAQYVVLGFSAEQLTLALTEHWRLPPLLHAGLHPETTGNPRAAGIKLTARLSRAADDWYSAGTTAVLEEIAEHLGKDLGTTAGHVHRIAAAAAREARFGDTRPLAAGLLVPSRPEAAPDRERARADADPQTGLCLMPQPEAYRHALAELERARSPVHFDTLLETAMEGLHDGLGLNRVLFAGLNHDRSQLRARACRGGGSETGLEHLEVDLDGGHLLARFMEKPRAVWMNGSNRDKFQPLLPEAFRRAARAGHFFMMSAFTGRRALGLFYADRYAGAHDAACELDETSYERFKALVLAFARALAREKTG